MLKKLKLNNKGMTTVEILVSFILISMISATLFTTVSNYNMKRQLENNKLEINTYKNLLTKTIQDDLIKIGVQTATVQRFTSGNADVFVANLKMSNTENRRLVVFRQLTNDYLDNASNSTKRNWDDEFHILYGKPTNATCSAYSNCTAGLIEEITFPKLGESKNSFGRIIQDLRITNVNFDVSNDVLTLFIGFNHVDFLTQYAINIATPLNFG